MANRYHGDILAIDKDEPSEDEPPSSRGAPSRPHLDAGRSDSDLTDHIESYRLPTTFCEDYVEHRIAYSDRERGIRKAYKRQRWITQPQLIGRGGFGVVRLQREKKSSQLRAVKEVPHNSSAAAIIDPVRELIAMAVLSRGHQNLYIAMEYFELGDLGKCVSGPLPEIECQTIIAQVTEAVEFMHQRNFAHRDLKPTNIFVAQRQPQWWVKVADFGISKRYSDTTNLYTMLDGDSRFAAPELMQFSDDTTVTASVDIWSLGCLVAWLLLYDVLLPTSRMFAFAMGRYKIPFEKLMSQGSSTQAAEFVEMCLAYHPSVRLTATTALEHPWLRDISIIVDSDGSSTISSVTARDSNNSGTGAEVQGSITGTIVTPLSANGEPSAQDTPLSRSLDGYRQSYESSGDYLDHESLPNQTISSYDPAKVDPDYVLCTAAEPASREAKRQSFNESEDEDPFWSGANDECEDEAPAKENTARDKDHHVMKQQISQGRQLVNTFAEQLAQDDAEDRKWTAQKQVVTEAKDDFQGDMTGQIRPSVTKDDTVAKPPLQTPLPKEGRLSQNANNVTGVKLALLRSDGSLPDLATSPTAEPSSSAAVVITTGEKSTNQSQHTTHRPPVKNDELLSEYDIDDTDFAQRRPSISYDDIVGRFPPSERAREDLAPLRPSYKDTMRTYSQTSDLNNYSRYEDDLSNEDHNSIYDPHDNGLADNPAQKPASSIQRSSDIDLSSPPIEAAIKASTDTKLYVAPPQ